MNLPLRPWSEVERTVPHVGRPLLACFDEATVTVFAAHRPEIGAWAIDHGTLGGPAWRGDRIARFRLSLPRVMSRSERGERAGKEVLLAIALRRDGFDAVLRQAVHWREFPASIFGTRGKWRLATRYTEVVVDFAPDCAPDGSDLPRMTPRFGVRGHALKAMLSDWVVGVRDLGDLALAWRGDPDPPTPVLRPYPLAEPEVARTLSWEPEA